MLLSGFVSVTWLYCSLVYFLFEFSETVMSVCCLFSWVVHLVCSPGMPAAVGSWDSVMSCGKKC